MQIINHKKRIFRYRLLVGLLVIVIIQLSCAHTSLFNDNLILISEIESRDNLIKKMVTFIKKQQALKATINL